MSENDTKPEFRSAEDESIEVATKPVRDPSLDTLLEGFDDRIDPSPSQKAGKVRVHTPPNAHTDPYPEEPVVAPNLTAPLSAVTKAKPRPAAAAAHPKSNAKPRLDPTFVVDREPTMTPRSWAIVGACGVAVVGALGVTIWAAQNAGDEPHTTLDHDPPAASLATALTPAPPVSSAPSPALVASHDVPNPGVIPPNATTKSPKSPGSKAPATPAASGSHMDHGLD